MKVLNRLSGVITIGIILFVIQGCSAFMNFNDGTLTIDDIIVMSKENINPDVIIHQIKKTCTMIKLNTADIIRLKNDGVENSVIEYMIEPDLERLKYKGLVIQDPEDKRNIRGFVYIPVDVWGSTLRPSVEAKEAVMALTDGFEKFTDILLKVDYHLYLESPKLRKYPFIYLTADELFDLSAIERENLAKYLRNGGFAFIEPHSPQDFMFYQNSLASFKQMIRDSFGDNARFEPIPDEHQLFHCFFDLESAPYLVPKFGRDKIYMAKLLIGDEDFLPIAPYLQGLWINNRLAVVFSDNQYGYTWSNYDFDGRFDNPFFRICVNMIVFALIQEDGIAEKSGTFNLHKWCE